MGNSPSGNDRVDIFQGGCGGNMGWLFGASFSPHGMDQRLGQFMTEAEYARTIEQCNGTLRMAQKKNGSVCIVMFVCILISVALVLTFQEIHTPEIIKCGATAGNECDQWTSEEQADASDCCIWTCCEGTSCTRIDKTDDTECECYTSGKNTVCHEVKIVGPLDITPEVNGWAAVAAAVCGGLAALCCVGNILQSIAGICSLNGQMSRHFDEWRSKGLRAEYFPGSRHSRARIMVYLPQGPCPPPAAMVGAGRSMQVAVPEGAAAGTTIQVQAPTGETVQAQVPPGIPSGGVFTLQY